MDFNYPKDSKEQKPFQHYLEAYANADPLEISSRLQIPYEEESRCFTVKLLGTAYQVRWPDLEISHAAHAAWYYPLDEMINAKTLVLRYLLESKAAEPYHEFKTFRELPWGEIYQQQFHGRCIQRLAYSFGNQPDVFDQVLQKMYAIKLSHGDVSYQVEIFNGYDMQFILWQGDDEFPPSAQILFSDNFSTGFSGEDRVVAGDVCIGTFQAISNL